jgi:catechol 2,3-dioxygenase-like lactoylglutathione lyase family enzyme
VDMKLGVVVLAVSDVDRAKAFYRCIGFEEELDYAAGEGFRVVRFTPPGSEASIVFGIGVTGAAPGSVQGLHLLVADIDAARDKLSEGGAEVTDVFHDIGGVFYHVSPMFEIPGPDPDRRDHRSFARFTDPDGNGWILEEVRSPISGDGAHPG